MHPFRAFTAVLSVDESGNWCGATTQKIARQMQSG
jgi:hypothetical protein